MRLTKKGGQDMDTLKILVVDDESRMRKLVKDFLTKKSFQVLEAGDGEEILYGEYDEIRYRDLGKQLAVIRL